ncbi:MAG: Stp1/IreP family PP2C-type Ser/Thr phosphatase [Cystobacterineae bacterium]|nr:Stp1/IreP family PP2C-type Ser/Thr phosphatase [Cystobacterineae bacterium]
MRILMAGQTHVGMKRTHNEDNLLVMPDEHLSVVADGMGGHASGEIASQIAVDEMANFFLMTAKDHEATWPFKMDKARNYDENRLATGIKLANVRIYERQSSDPKFRGMGTTIVSAYFTSNCTYIAHVGDSRSYFLRSGTLKQLTEDHSLLNDYLKTKKLAPEEIDNFPHKNVILRALGMKNTVQVDLLRVVPQPGDLFLLCSDGLSGMVSDPEIANILSSASDLDKTCSSLIQAANDKGGTDNITCVLIRCFAS